MTFIKSFALVLIVWVASASIAFSQTTDNTKTVTLKVKGITCSTDLKTISASVAELKGVSSCKTGKMGPTSSFVIEFNPALVSEKEINLAIENTAGCKNPNDRPYKIKQ